MVFRCNINNFHHKQHWFVCFITFITAIIATNDLLGTGDCGNRPLVDDRIVGGQNVRDAWPWMASMRDINGNHRCGASLISPNWAITAAHCE